VAALLHEAGETQHRVYRIVDGSEMVWLLVGLDKEYTQVAPEQAWPAWYAERVIDHFASRE